MRLPVTFISLTFLFSTITSAQTPASATLSANRVKAQFNANGALFTDLTGRAAFSQDMTGAVMRLNVPVAALPNGMYLAEIWLDSGARG